MGLLVKASEIKNSSALAKDRWHTNPEHAFRRRVYGNNGSLMAAARLPDYHSFPHVHHCEQLNYCVDGEIWIFVGEEGYLLEAGDFHRVPSGAVHWAWNRSDKPCTLVESHVPQMAFEPERQQYLIGLFDEGEEPDIQGRAYLIFDEAYVEQGRRVETRLFGSSPL